MIQLKCGCKVTEEGKFVVSVLCAGCRECNLVATLHPFGEGRLP